MLIKLLGKECAGASFSLVHVETKKLVCEQKKIHDRAVGWKFGLHSPLHPEQNSGRLQISTNSTAQQAENDEQKNENNKKGWIVLHRTMNGLDTRLAKKTLENGSGHQCLNGDQS